MDLKIVAVGSNEIIAREVSNAIKVIIGNIGEIITVTTASVQNDSGGDFFVCAVTQREPLLKVIAPQKLIVLDLRPTTEFFIRVSRIPAGEKVIIFNSNIEYAQLLRNSCESLNIKDVEFIPIGYEEMPGEAVISKLKQAKYIIGVGKLVEEEALLSDRYKPHLHPNVTIIGNTRVATMQSACFLIQQITEHFHTKASKEIGKLVADLKHKGYLSVNRSNEECIATKIEKLIAQSNNAILSMRDNIMKSFAAQISWNIVMKEQNIGGKDDTLFSEEAEGTIFRALENINMLNNNVIDSSAQSKS